ncbi:MAG: aldo/keto reductase [Candidatus Omnitrophica bacterium]|nr:aldo/keto reductase [Candidatus Omnitrophota bacterium]
MIEKIVLGTAQFGLDYGINNKRGKIPKDEAFEILDTAVKNRINTIDTAYAYGESEEVIGRFLKMKSYYKNLKIISKLPSCSKEEIKSTLDISLKRLSLSRIYGYLIHNFKNYKENPLIWKELERLKQNSFIEKIGFSLYYPLEIELLFKDNLKIDIVQMPFNIFDQRFEPYFKEIKKRNIELYVRSVFLQGLVFKAIDEIDEFFNPIKDKLQQLNLFSKEKNISILSLCINFALKNKFIDKVVVGIDNLNHLYEIINSMNDCLVNENTISQLRQFRLQDEKILLPFNWPKMR